MALQYNYPLHSLNTFGISSYAECFATFQSIDELQQLLVRAKYPIVILGGGSNILLTRDVKGTVLKNEINGISIVEEDHKSITVKVGGGVVWQDLVMWSIENNFGGIENLSLIPGSVGAAAVQNIGAYGIEITSVFKELEAVNIANNSIKNFSKADCEFGYRNSIFKSKLKGQYVICNVTFQLNKIHEFNTTYPGIEEELKAMGVEPSLQNISQAVINIRQCKLPDPKEIGNSGSFFKNPTVPNEQFETLKTKFPNMVGYSSGKGETKVAAGWLIEQAGWKGYHNNKAAGVHKKHALVLVNYGNAKGEDILNLSKEIQESVLKKFGIDLQSEVNII
jgi:UDP-N-acetylmuramate dehydrogenase